MNLPIRIRCKTLLEASRKLAEMQTESVEQVEIVLHSRVSTATSMCAREGCGNERQPCDVLCRKHRWRFDCGEDDI